MITLITGAPGAGKTAALVDLLREIVEKRRKVYVDGIPELTVEHELIEAGNWHEPGVVEDGSAIVVDEAQRLWRPAGPGAKVPPDVAALETHRHRGLDFFVVTQHPNLINQNVRRLVGRHIHLRDLGVLGRRWYEWPEATDPGRYKSAPVQKRYSLPKRVFGAYKSASLHIKPKRSVPPALIAAGVGVLALGGIVWYGVSNIGGKVTAAKQATPAAGAASAPGRAPGPPGGFAPARTYAAVAVSAPVVNREPFAGLRVHSLGGWSPAGEPPRLSFALSIDGRLVRRLRDVDLARAGYIVRALDPCSVVLVWDGRERFVTCDTPATAAPAPAQAASGAAPAAAPLALGVSGAVGALGG